ncbi:KBTBD8 [Branchiostoma lanceolatum]|uniref:KBTBD8 protein n=1 Tax=Branchiostoma lanceolatum TaxID=7740 RepID=A0A8K0EX36_BRALA|nr:KBTBD8 [Branchiostoma lanceolatum]
MFRGYDFDKDNDKVDGFGTGATTLGTQCFSLGSGDGTDTPGLIRKKFRMSCRPFTTLESSYQVPRYSPSRIEPCCQLCMAACMLCKVKQSIADNVIRRNDIISRKDDSCFENCTHGRGLLAELDSQRQAGEFTDVVVQVEGREFLCHRAVLVTMPYFKTMLSSSLADSPSPKAKVVQLCEINSISFSKILDFLYTGEISIGKDDVKDILQAAHLLHFDYILKHYREFLQDNFCSSNSPSTMRLNDVPKSSARNTAASNLSDVTQDEEFLSTGAFWAQCSVGSSGDTVGKGGAAASPTKIYSGGRSPRTFRTMKIIQPRAIYGSRRHVNYTQGRNFAIAELVSQRKTGEYTDVVVQVEGREFPCHRAVLATTPYFKTMLSSDLAESSSKVVQLRGIDSNSFSKILDFLYTGEIRIGEDDVQDILQAVHMLQFDDIQQCCSKFIQNNLCLSNSLDAMRLADMYGLSDLKGRAIYIAGSNFLFLTRRGEFLNLSLQELLDILGSVNVTCTKKEEVVRSVMRWLDHVPDENRQTAIVRILKETCLSCVRFSMKGELDPLPVIPCESAGAGCLTKVTAAIGKQLLSTQMAAAEKGEAKRSPKRRASILVGPRRPEPPETLSGILAVPRDPGLRVRTRVRTSDNLAIFVGGWKAVRKPHLHDDLPFIVQPPPLQSIVCLDPDSQQYYHITNLPTPVAGYMSVACADGYLYVTGGRIHPLVGEGPQTAPSRQVFRYDFLSDIWVRLPDMPRGRAGHQSVIANGNLFLVGGDTEEESSFVTMDCYYPPDMDWMKIPVLPAIPTSSNLTISAAEDNVLFIEVSKSGDEQKVFVHTIDSSMHWWSMKVPKLKEYMYFEGTYFHTLCENSYRYMHGQKGIVDTISHYEVEDRDNPVKKTPLPFALFGHCFLETQKSRVRWYDRDCAALEKDDELQLED